MEQGNSAIEICPHSQTNASFPRSPSGLLPQIGKFDEWATQTHVRCRYSCSRPRRGTLPITFRVVGRCVENFGDAEIQQLGLARRVDRMLEGLTSR